MLRGCALTKYYAGLLHTIMFHRALGVIHPREVQSESFDITYVSCPGLPIVLVYLQPEQMNIKLIFNFLCNRR